MADLTDNARRIFDLRYSRKDEHGQPTEDPETAIQRVASNVASVTALYVEGHPDDAVIDPDVFPYRTARRQYEWLGGESKMVCFEDKMGLGYLAARSQADRYYEMLDSLDFLPNSPTWTGAGTELGQLAACFVLPVDDDLVTGDDSIYATMKNAVAIQQTGGGNGFSFGRLRPKGALVKRSMGKASGPMGFAKAYNATFAEMAQGGTRRGANMLVLPVHHPDIREFIGSKVVEGELDQFNISVAITDEFMEAVEKDAEFDLRHDGVVYETIQARDLWDTITQNAWVMGDPGNLFIDRANAENPVPTRYTLEATNPCGEQWLGPYENCCLGSINLANFADWGADPDSPGFFDWPRFRETVELATEFLDDVVDANQYVGSVPQLEQAAQGGRRIGLGLMGLADAMLKMGLRYGDDDGIAFASQVTEFARYHCMLTSIDRAKERGPFPWIENSIYDPALIASEGPGAMAKVGEITFRLWEPPAPLNWGFQAHDFGRPPVEWGAVTEGLVQHGIRNCAQFTFAPTGTISNVAGCEGSGCEPVFALTYLRKVMQDGEDITLSYASPLFAEALRRHGFDDGHIALIAEEVKDNGGSCQGLDGLVPAEIQHAFVVAADVSVEGHVRTQAALQRFVDNSISKTINMPNEATVEDVAATYQMAYDLGCKGITIYRQGSRDLEVLSTGKKPEVTDINIVDWPTIRPLSIPTSASDEGLPAKVFPVETAFGKVQVTITEHPEHPGRPFDVRLQLGKAGNDKNADVEALGRMISGNTRAGVAVEWIVEQLDGIGGSTVHGFGERKVKSVADGVSKLLARRYLAMPESTPEATEEVRLLAEKVDPERICPECHNATLVMESGCRHCEVRLGGCGNYSGCD